MRWAFLLNRVSHSHGRKSSSRPGIEIRSRHFVRVRNIVPFAMRPVAIRGPAYNVVGGSIAEAAHPLAIWIGHRWGVRHLRKLARTLIVMKCKQLARAE